jgi:hypothetical protein
LCRGSGLVTHYSKALKIGLIWQVDLINCLGTGPWAQSLERKKNKKTLTEDVLVEDRNTIINAEYIITWEEAATAAYFNDQILLWRG